MDGDIGTLEVHQTSFFVMDTEGDTRLQFNRNDPEQVAAARQRFNELKRKNYLAYSVDKSGDRGEVLEEFDPAAERIVFAPQMIGG